VIIQTLIVEDEPLPRQTLRQLISATPWLELVGEAADGSSAVQEINELKPKLIFLDIELPEMNGLQVLDRISYQPELVFTTAYDHYALSAFELDALDYLLKPFGQDRFRQTLERIRRRLSVSNMEELINVNSLDRARSALRHADAGTPITRLFVREDDMLLPVMVKDIIRLEANNDYTAVHVNGKSHLIHLGLSECTARLDPQKFLRVHRSHTVNLDHVKAAEEFDRRVVLYLSDGSEVTASRFGAQQFRKLFTWV
jgi:two-component system, LytTR family, response regulator